MTEHVSATLVDHNTLLVDGVPFDRRSAEPDAVLRDGTAAGRRLESLYQGDIQRMGLCQRIVHLERLVGLMWRASGGDAEAARRARSETRALGLG